MQMHRPAAGIDDDLLWRAVCAEQPCPVCQGMAGCGVVDAEGFVLCRVVPSAHPVDVGGWLHRRAARDRTH